MVFTTSSSVSKHPNSSNSVNISQQFGIDEAIILFENGRRFYCDIFNISKSKHIIGDICFNTSITGYQEIISDPSYAGQIILFTFPHIGIVGANEIDIEFSSYYYDSDTSSPILTKGVICNDLSLFTSNHRHNYSLINWLQKYNIPVICNLDTRAITRMLSKEGEQKMIAMTKKDFVLEKAQEMLLQYESLSGQDLASNVATSQPYQLNIDNISTRQKYVNQYAQSTSLSNRILNLDKHNHKNRNPKIAVIDFGIKHNILQSLSYFTHDIKVFGVSNIHLLEEIKNYGPEGIFLSNGPGDPEATYLKYESLLRDILDIALPIFGICLGHQILSLLFGCKTVRMEQGHHGGNHPVQDLKSQIVEITSQNHSFVVDESTLPENVKITHRSLFDDTIEGIEILNKNIFSVQYHPESSPGPHDSHYLFTQFFDKIS